MKEVKIFMTDSCLFAECWATTKRASVKSFPQKKGAACTAPFSKGLGFECLLGFDLANFLPTTRFAGIQNRFTNVLSFQGITEIGTQWPLLA